MMQSHDRKFSKDGKKTVGLMQPPSLVWVSWESVIRLKSATGGKSKLGSWDLAIPPLASPIVGKLPRWAKGMLPPAKRYTMHACSNDAVV